MKFAVRNGLVHMPMPEWVMDQFQWLNELPKSVFVKGGAARSIARAVITGDDEPVRDIDLMSTYKLKDKVERKLCERFMPEDYERGHGVEVRSVKEYFWTRDFTINEILVTKEEIIMTPNAFRSMKNNFIAPSQNERVGTRQKAKALYLCAVCWHASGKFAYCSKEFAPDDEEIEGYALWNYAQFFNKAMQRGKAVAAKMALLMNSVGNWFSTEPIVLASELRQKTGFEFRPGTECESSGPFTGAEYDVINATPLESDDIIPEEAPEEE